MVRIVFRIIIRLIRRCTGVGVMPVFISLVSIAYLMFVFVRELVWYCGFGWSEMKYACLGGDGATGFVLLNS